MENKAGKETKESSSPSHMQFTKEAKSTSSADDYDSFDKQQDFNSKDLSPGRFNPLALRFKRLEHSSMEGIDQIRTQARRYEKIALKSLWRVKNRGRGDTAVNGMIFASRQLLNVSRRALRKTITPKLVYEFRYAKSEFEKAKKMSVAKATKLPYAYHKDEIRRRREEEEDRVIPIIHDGDDYTKLDSSNKNSKHLR